VTLVTTGFGKQGAKLGHLNWFNPFQVVQSLRLSHHCLTFGTCDHAQILEPRVPQDVFQSDLGWRAGAVGPDVGVADLLATGAFGPGLPESPPSRHAGSAGPASLTRVMAGGGHEP
jgi:hypothetical protein